MPEIFDAGQLDRRICFQENTPTLSASGSRVPSWGAFFYCNAKKSAVSPTRRDEKFAAFELVAWADVIFLIRYPVDADVFPNGVEARITPKETCRLVDEAGRVYDVVRVFEPVGYRHQWLQIYAFARGE